MKHGPCRRLCVAWCVVALSLGPSAADERRDPPAFDSGLVERTGVSLMLIDVEVTDADGRPVRGLTLDDFSVRLDGKRQSIYSVDDLCGCEPPSPAAPPLVAEPSREEVGPATEPAAAPLPPTEPVRYVLYLDYALMQIDGRHRAAEKAKRWVRETMQPGDLVMLTAHASATGLRTLVHFTTDKPALLAEIERSYAAPQFNDPFCDGRELRIEKCAEVCCKEKICDCRACFVALAGGEYFHQRHSLQALQLLLERLDSVPGRKALLLFHQDGTQDPVGYYPAAAGRIGDHVTLLDRVAAEANLARTSIHVAFTGYENPLAVNLGANLADATGGSYNRGPGRLDELTSGAGRGCACLYRIGLVPPPNAGRHTYRMRVEAAGRNVPHRYLVRHPDEGERWWRAARTVLAEPSTATDVPVLTSVIPVAGRHGGWDVDVLVTLDPDAVLTLPTPAGGGRGNWEVGALLANATQQRSWEMLGVSELRRKGTEPTPLVVLHEQRIEDVAPGAWELRAFVRDRTANVYGGAQATIDLPRPGRRPQLGPLLVLRGGATYLRTELPLRRGGSREAKGAQWVQGGSLPTAGAVRAGELLYLVVWVCPGEKKERMGDVERYIAREGEALFRFEQPRITEGGECTSLTDALDTTPMAAGRYTYNVYWPGRAGEEPLTATASFEVVQDTVSKAGMPDE